MSAHLGLISVGGIVGTVGNGIIGRIVGKVVGSVATSVFSAIAHGFGEFASHLTAWVFGQLGSSTQLSLSGPGWGQTLGVTAGLGVLVCVATCTLQVIFSVLRADPAGLGRAVRGTLIASLGMFLALSLTEALLKITDTLSGGVMQTLAGTATWSAMTGKLLGAGGLMALSMGPEALIVVAGVLITASVTVWLALMVRKLLLIIAAVFVPIAFAGSPFDLTASWRRKWTEFTVAMIFSKLILVIIFCVGLQTIDGMGLADAHSITQQLTQFATGLLILCLAGLSPWLALRMVHWMGDGLGQAHQHGQAVDSARQAALDEPQRQFSGPLSDLGWGSIGAGAAGMFAGRSGGQGSGTGADAGQEGMGASPEQTAGSAGAAGSPAGAAATNGSGVSAGSGGAGGVGGLAGQGYAAAKSHTEAALGEASGGQDSGQGEDGGGSRRQDGREREHDSQESGDAATGGGTSGQRGESEIVDSVPRDTSGGPGGGTPSPAETTPSRGHQGGLGEGGPGGGGAAGVGGGPAGGAGAAGV
jgi:type IV secretion system protein TrbL